MRNPHSHNTRINSPSYKQFVEVPHADIQRSTFDRSVVDGQDNAKNLLAPASGLITMDATLAAGTAEMYADLSDATSATINQLRLAFATQKFLERQARSGSRYIEVIKGHFNVTSPDARLQRPEYIGGGSSAVNISPVAQTSSTDATTPQGNLSAIGTSVISGHSFTKSATEHCILIGVVSVRTALTYQQGLNRMFSRSTIYDY